MDDRLKSQQGKNRTHVDDYEDGPVQDEGVLRKSHGNAILNMCISRMNLEQRWRRCQ